MKNLKNKLNKKGGFTLIEMLIVVAIIAILMAISIPLVNGALERARIATDGANERAAKAEASIIYLSQDLNASLGETFEAEKVYAYDAAKGKLNGTKTDWTNIEPYGKCESHDGSILFVAVMKDGQVYLHWNNPTTYDRISISATLAESNWNKGLCSEAINK